MSEFDDDDRDGGIGTLAAWQLGRWSAESAASRANVFEALRQARRGPAVDVNQLLANNQALAAENERLRHDLQAYKRNYILLKKWADEVEPVLASLRTQRD